LGKNVIPNLSKEGLLFPFWQKFNHLRKKFKIICFPRWPEHWAIFGAVSS
jgi:hypothetical protein